MLKQSGFGTDTCLWFDQLMQKAQAQVLGVAAALHFDADS